MQTCFTKDTKDNTGAKTPSSDVNLTHVQLQWHELQAIKDKSSFYLFDWPDHCFDELLKWHSDTQYYSISIQSFLIQKSKKHFHKLELKIVDVWFIKSLRL